VISDAYGFGRTWVVEEMMGRASHALADDGRLWLIDPVDSAVDLERALELGEPAGVIQLLDRHPRDCEELARRFGVPHLRLPDAIPDSPFEVLTVVDLPKWREKALWWPDRGVLVVAEAVGTVAYFRAGAPLAGIHPFLRVLPPGGLRDYEPEHLLVGHGSPLHGFDAAEGLRDAYRRSRRDIPSMIVRLPFSMRG